MSKSSPCNAPPLDPRETVWQMIAAAIQPESMDNNPKPVTEGLLGVHPIALLSADPLNASELCGWEAVVVPQWISSTPGYGVNHVVGLNVWGRDDYSTAQVSSHLLALFSCSTCAGMGVRFIGPRRDKDGFWLAIFTLSWRI